MLAMKREFLAMRCSALVVLSALGSTLAVLAFAAAPAGAAVGDHFSCRASALRVTALPPLLNSEPKVANSAADPCKSDHPAPTASVLLPPLLTTGVVSASTTSAANSAAATGQVANVSLFGPLGLTADVATASAQYVCSAGTPTPQSSSSVVNLRLNGAPITVSGTYSLPLLIGGVATIQLDGTITSGSSVTRRAVDITVLGGVDNGVHVVLAEATVGFSGNPCDVGTTGLTPPVIQSGPPSSTPATTQTFVFIIQPGATLQCSLDGHPFAACNATTTFTHLSIGWHSVSIRELRNGVLGPVYTFRWKVTGRATRCPRATGGIHGMTLGRVRLGMTVLQARTAYRLNSTWSKPNQDFFCLTPVGVRVEYASGAMLLKLTAGQRRALLGRVVLALTANTHYVLGGVRHGARLPAARRALGAGNLFHIGLNWWYFAPHGSWTAVLKVRHGIVAEVGIANGRLTSTRKAQLGFIGRASR